LIKDKIHLSLIKKMNYIIYKMNCMEFEYIGMTKNLRLRKKGHRKVFRNKKHVSHNSKVYKTIRDNYSWELVYFEIILDGLTKAEAKVMEDIYIRKLDPQICLNSQNGIYTKEDMRKNAQEYYKKNKAKIIKKMMEIVPCEICGKKTTWSHLRRHQRTSKCKKIKKNLLHKYYKRWRENIKKV